MMPTRLLGEGCSLLSALLWASAIIFFRKSGETVPPLALNVFKCAVASLLFLATLAITGEPLLPADHGWRNWATLLLSGAIGIGVADTLFFSSLNHLGASRSAVVNCAYGPFVVLWGALYLGEPMRPHLVGGMVLMASAILVVTSSALPATIAPIAPVGRDERRAVATGILSMFLMAGAIAIAKPVLASSGALWATTVRIIGGQVYLTAQTLAGKQREQVLRAFLPSGVWRVTVPAAFLGSYLAMLVWIVGMKHTHISVAGIINQTSTLFVPLLAAAFLGEKLTRRKGLATILGFSGAVLCII